MLAIDVLVWIGTFVLVIALVAAVWFAWFRPGVREPRQRTRLEEQMRAETETRNSSTRGFGGS